MNFQWLPYICICIFEKGKGAARAGDARIEKK